MTTQTKLLEEIAKLGFVKTTKEPVNNKQIYWRLDLNLRIQYDIKKDSITHIYRYEKPYKHLDSFQSALVEYGDNY